MTLKSLYHVFYPPEGDPCIDALIVPPRYTSRLAGEDFSKADPSLRERTLRRRESAEQIRARSYKLDAGEQTPVDVRKRWA